MADEMKKGAVSETEARQLRILDLQEKQLMLQSKKIEADLEAAAGVEKRQQQSLEQNEKTIAEEKRQRLGDARKCNHRQGGTRNRPLRGSGPTSLKEIVFPMGPAIRCGTCRMTVFKPHPYQGITKRKKGESEEAMATRLLKFAADTELYDELQEQMDSHSMTEESSRPMDGGAKFQWFDADHREVFPPRPSDAYVLKYDSTTLAAK